jgi:hypothetical protein
MQKNVAAATIVVLSVCGSHASFAGLTYKVVNSTDGERTSTAQIWIEGDRSKSEILDSEADNPFMPPGSYTIASPEGVYLVNPAQRTFSRFDMSMLEGMAQAVSAPGTTGSFQFTNARIEKTVDEIGEAIEGYSTRHYQFKAGWTMAMTGMPMSTDFNAVEDIWTTDQIAGNEAATMSVAQSAIPASVRDLAGGQVLEEATGFVLRSVTRQTSKTNMTGMGGLGGRMAQNMMNRAAQDTTIVFEASDIEEIAIPPETFAIPDDYSETQLIQTGPAIPDLNSLPGQPGAAAPALPDLNDVR